MTEVWCPFAVKAPVPGHTGGFGEFIPGVPKIVHHTTEGGSYIGAYVTYRKTGALPHFTDSFEGGTYGVWQHLPIDVAASALKHPAHSGETNRDNAIQIEHVGFAATSSRWLPGYLDGIGRLCRWIEQQTGCRPVASARFAAGAPRLDWASWHMSDGHLGHMHVPWNDHVDPGAIDINRILATTAEVKAMYDPPLTDIVASRPAPGKGTWLLKSDGAIFAIDGAPYAGGANGKPYFAGRHAADFADLNDQEQAAGKLYVILSKEPGGRYAYPE